MIELYVIYFDAIMHFVGTYQFGIDSLDKQQTLNKSILNFVAFQDRYLLKVYTHLISPLEKAHFKIEQNMHAQNFI